MRDRVVMRVSNTFSQKLDKLFKTITKANGEEFTPEEVEVATEKAITSSYIYRLRTGKSSNPTIDKVQALAEFFGIDPSYFFADEETEPATDPERLVASVALRARNMDLKTLEDMLAIIRTLRGGTEVEAKSDNEME